MGSTPGRVAASVDVARAESVTVTWDDGHVTRLPLALLRARCPCAICHGRRRLGHEVDQGPVAVGAVELSGAELVGAWALALAWSDGHATGVYEWRMLRSWCACPACTDER